MVNDPHLVRLGIPYPHGDPNVVRSFARLLLRLSRHTSLLFAAIPVLASVARSPRGSGFRGQAPRSSPSLGAGLRRSPEPCRPVRLGAVHPVLSSGCAGWRGRASYTPAP